ATVVGTACRGDGSLDGCGRCGDAVDGTAGAVAPAAGRFAIRREVASADARAGSGAGAAAAGPATAAPVEAPDWLAAAICAIRSTGAGACATGTVPPATAGAPAWSPGHSSTSRVPSEPASKRGARTTTGIDRSNTTRVVPGVGCPVRTALTTPAPAGGPARRASRLLGKSTTRRSGADSAISLYSASA